MVKVYVFDCLSIQIQTNISIFEKRFTANPNNNDNIDLFFFWKTLQLLYQMDEEDNTPSILSNQHLNENHHMYYIPKRQPWLNNGITNVLISNSSPKGMSFTLFIIQIINAAEIAVMYRRSTVNSSSGLLIVVTLILKYHLN